MTLLAHWPIDDGIYRPSPATVRDIAAGGSGAHDGEYNWGTYGGLYPGGVGGRHFRADSSSYVKNITNPSDLRLLGSITIMLWAWVEDLYHWDYGARRLVSCSVSDLGSEATNDCFLLRSSSYELLMSWQYSASQTTVNVTSIVDILPYSGPVHIAVVRYEISPGFYGVKFYLDGVLVDTQDNSGVGWPAPTGGGSCVPYIGRDVLTSSAAFFIDSVRIYDSEESDANILSVFDSETDIIHASEFDHTDHSITPVGMGGYIYQHNDGPDQSVVQVGMGGDIYRGVHSGPNSGRIDAGWVQL